MRTLLYGALLLAPTIALSNESETQILITSGLSDKLQPIGLQPDTVIDRETIRHSQARNLAEVLSGQAGLQVTDLFGNGLQTSVDMRGFGPTAGSNVLILVDGRRLNNSSDTGAPALYRIPVDSIERIEITRGSAGVRYGNQAVGGVINIITRDTDLPRAFVETTAGSYNSIEGVFGLTQNLSESVSLHLDGNYQESDNYRDNNAMTLRYLNARLKKTHADGFVELEVSGNQDWWQLPGALNDSELQSNRRQSADDFAGDYSKRNYVTSAITIEQAVNQNWLLTGDISYRDETGEFQNSFRGSPSPAYPQIRKVTSFQPRLIGKIFENTRLTFGIDLENTDYSLDAVVLQEVTQRIQDGFVIGDIQLTEKLSLSSGLRYSSIENDITFGSNKATLNDSATLGNLAIRYQFAPSWTGFVRIDENLRYATVDEHTNTVYDMVSKIQQPIGLKNQTGRSYETGLTWENAATRIQFSAYQLDLKNEISFDSSTYYNINLDRTRRNGFTLEVDHNLTSNWTAGTQYTFTDGKITDGPFAGNVIPLVAKNTGRFYLLGRLNKNSSFFAETIYTGKRYLGADYYNTQPELDNSILTNMAFLHDRGNVQVALRINNLFDEQYIASGSTDGSEKGYFSAPKRNFSLSVRYNF